MMMSEKLASAGVATLLAKFAKIAAHEVSIKRAIGILSLDLHPKGAVLEHHLIILPPAEKRLGDLNNLEVHRNVVFHPNLILSGLDVEHGSWSL